MVKSTDWFKKGPSISKWFSYRLQICVFSGLVIWVVVETSGRTSVPNPKLSTPRGSILVVNYVHHTIGPIFYVQYHYRYVIIIFFFCFFVFVFFFVFCFFNFIFFSKSSRFRVVRTIRFVQIPWHMVQTLLPILMLTFQF